MAFALALLAACGSSGSSSGPGSASGSGSSSGSASGSAAAAVAVAAPDAAAARSDDRCADPCRFLADTPLADVATTFAATCGASAAWPAPATCDDHDLLRNCIYAAHGYTFSKPRWRDAFTAKPWYHPRADFRDADLGAVATANISALRQRAKECRAGNAITPADRTRVEAFFATVTRGKPAFPPVLIDNLEIVTAAELAPTFAKRANYRLEPSTPMTYVPAFDELTASLPGETLRVIRVDLSGCQHVAADECENSFWIDLAYDATNTLVALRHGMAG